jgi:hypothetical protein
MEKMQKEGKVKKVGCSFYLQSMEISQSQGLMISGLKKGYS